MRFACKWILILRFFLNIIKNDIAIYFLIANVFMLPRLLFFHYQFCINWHDVKDNLGEEQLNEEIMIIENNADP